MVIGSDISNAIFCGQTHPLAAWNNFMETIRPGRYRHFKGKMYEVIAVAKHSETLEDYVVYKALYKNPKAEFWIRPLKNFLEKVELNGKTFKRFQLIAKDK